MVLITGGINYVGRHCNRGLLTSYRSQLLVYCVSIELNYFSFRQLTRIISFHRPRVLHLVFDELVLGNIIIVVHILKFLHTLNTIQKRQLVFGDAIRESRLALFLTFDFFAKRFLI